MINILINTCFNRRKASLTFGFKNSILLTTSKDFLALLDNKIVVFNIEVSDAVILLNL